MDPSALTLLEPDKVVVYGKEVRPLSLNDVRAKIVIVLHKQQTGLSGSQLAKAIGVSQAAVFKAADSLMDLGILRKEPLKQARNVKVYYLTTRIVDDKEIARLRKHIPPIVQKLIHERLRNERTALVFADQVLRILGSLDDYDAKIALSEYFRITRETKREGEDEKSPNLV